MAKRSRVTTAKSEKTRQPRTEPAGVEVLSDKSTNLARLCGDSVQAQGARLGDSRFQSVQRQAVVAHIGQLQGNRHLQSVITSANGGGKTAAHQFHTPGSSRRSVSDAVPRFPVAPSPMKAALSAWPASAVFTAVEKAPPTQRNATATPAKIRAAIKYNNRKWRGKYRAKMLTFLRGTATSADESFTKADILRVMRGQRRRGLGVDGKIGEKTTAVALHFGLELAEAARVKARHVTLVFYPGELENLDAWRRAKRRTGGNWRGFGQRDVLGNIIEIPKGVGKLYVKVRGRLVAAYNARGGPPIKFRDQSHTAVPTPAGTYRLGRRHAHTTRSWHFSQIPYGAHLRWAPDGKNIQFKRPGGRRWEYATQVAGTRVMCRLGKPFTPDQLLDPNGRIPGEHWAQGLPKIYKLNDFGRVAWVLKRQGRRTPYYVHTTSYAEVETEVGVDFELTTSHGCLHLRPADRDEMMKRGYLQAGVRFVVKRYRAHLLPEKFRAALM